MFSRLRPHARSLAPRERRLRDGSSGRFANVRGQRDACGFEQWTDDASCWRAHDDLPTVLVELDLLQAVKFAQHIGPLGTEAGRVTTLIQLLAQNESKERTEDMAADRGV